MKALFKAVAILIAIFAVTFILLKSASGVTFEDVENWLHGAREVSPYHVATLIIALLLADLLVSVPTLTIVMLSGFLLGQALGTLVALMGLYSAGILGYGISRRYGQQLLTLLLKDPLRRAEAVAAFRGHGFGMIILARALPILPEVMACLAGSSRMPFSRFLVAWSLSCVPYAAIAAYAGSISTLGDPMPAISAAIGLLTSLWIGWFLFRRSTKHAALTD